MESVIISVLGGVLKTSLTEKAIANLIAVLLKFVVTKTSNDLDNRILEAVLDGLDKSAGQSMNLYDHVKTS